MNESSCSGLAGVLTFGRCLSIENSCPGSPAGDSFMAVGGKGEKEEDEGHYK